MELLERLGIGDAGHAAVVAMQEFASDRSVAILLRPEEDQLEIGSGTVIKVGGRYLVSTAGHNLSGVGREQIEVLPRGANLERPLSVVSLGRDGSRDLGWLELEAAEVEASTLRAVEGWQLGDLEEPPDAPAVVLVQGYPAARVELTGGASARTSVQSDGLQTLLVPARERSRPLTAGEFSVEYPPWDGSLDRSRLAPPPGVSGGSVWQVPIFEGEQLWALDQARLVGIAKSWRRRDKELVCSRIGQWLDVVS